MESIPVVKDDITFGELQSTNPFVQHLRKKTKITGVLAKTGLSMVFNKQWPFRTVVLSEGCIYIFKEKQPKPESRPSTAISLYSYYNIVVCKEADPDAVQNVVYPHAFIIKSAQSDKDLYFAADSEDQLMRWKSVIYEELKSANKVGLVPSLQQGIGDIDTDEICVDETYSYINPKEMDSIRARELLEMGESTPSSSAGSIGSSSNPHALYPASEARDPTDRKFRQKKVPPTPDHPPMLNVSLQDVRKKLRKTPSNQEDKPPLVREKPEFLKRQQQQNVSKYSEMSSSGVSSAESTPDNSGNNQPFTPSAYEDMKNVFKNNLYLRGHAVRDIELRSRNMMQSGLFYVRDSTREKGMLTLCVATETQIRKFKLVKKEEGSATCFYLELDSTKSFLEINDLLLYYKSHNLPARVPNLRLTIPFRDHPNYDG